MNFIYYHNILQQIEKPTFVFDRFDNQGFVKVFLKRLNVYLTEKGADGDIKKGKNLM